MKKSKSRKKVSSSLTRYSFATGAALAATVAPASASVIYFGSSSFTVDSSTPSFNWDIDGDGNIDFTLMTANAGGTIQAARVRSANAWLTGGHSSVKDVVPGPGQKVGSAGTALLHTFGVAAVVTFVNTGGIAAGLEAGTQDVGFEFTTDDYSQTDYGWASITIDAGADPSLTVNAWAYENTGAAILVGATIPEPADSALSVGLLALGAVGVAAYRKRKPAV